MNLRHRRNHQARRLAGKLLLQGDQSCSSRLGLQLAEAALQTETQVIVKREDEMAFAELNGSYLKFVEDAARLLYEQLITDKRIKDFRVICSHQESLHSHDAVSVILAPNSNFSSDVSHEIWSSLIHKS